jgi:hypothetical protein
VLLFFIGLTKNLRVVSDADEINLPQVRNLREDTPRYFFRGFVGIGSKFLCSLDFLVLFHQGKRTAAQGAILLQHSIQYLSL